MTSGTSNGRTSFLLFVLFFFSGATGLVYEVVWLRQLILIFGSTLFATSAVLATFMGGLALGSFVAGRIMDGRRLPPLRTYGFLEIGIGAYALVVPALFRALTPLYRILWDAGASDSFLAFSIAKAVGIAVVLLPPTVLMGASLPVLARQVADDPERIGGSVGALYAVNTFGAMAGTFLAGFVLIRWIGVRHTEWTAAAANLLVGAVAIALSRAASPPRPRGVTQAPRAIADARGRVALVLFGVSGFAAMALEVAWTRGLALVVGSSVYAFSLMLLAFLTGLALGSALLSAYLKRRPGRDAGAVLALLLATAGAAAYATAFAFQHMPRWFAEVYFRLSPGPDAWLVWQFLFGLAVMFPATLALGGVFPTVLQIHAKDLERVSGSVGVVYASNTVGTILGAALAGFAIVPGLGVRNTLVLTAALEILLGLVALFVLSRGTPRVRTALAVPMAAALAVVPIARPGWDILLMNSGVYMNVWDLPKDAGWPDFLRRVTTNNELVYFREGLTSSVLVADQPRIRNRYLSVNGKVEASTSGDMETQLLLSHLPLLLHPDPKDVAVIGLASGITAGAAAAHPVRSIRVIEVEAAMVPAARLFSHANGNVLDDPRLVLSINDARNELTFSSARYDVIVSEPSNPWMTVASNLFTEDFFHLARTRLRPGGILSQWIQTYSLSSRDLRSIIASFRAAFPEVLLFSTFDGIDLLLLGSDRPLRFDLERMASRISELKVRMDLGRIEVRSTHDLLPLFQLDAGAVARLVEGAPANTDDSARVEFSAPRSLYLDTTDENLRMLKPYVADPLTLLDPPPADEKEAASRRLKLARAWLKRDAPDIAARLAREETDGPLAAEAREFLSGIVIP